jgi:hypothetical protein
MNARLSLLRWHLPAMIRRAVLRELIRAMSEAFDRACPPTRGRSADELLATAVEVSSRWTRDAFDGGTDLHAIERRLFSEGFALGRRAKRRLGATTEREGLAAASVLYRAIGIDFRPGTDGQVVVPRCAFAAAYGSDACALMSAMDSGLIAGLTDAAGLRFTDRLTEGAPVCRAVVLHTGWFR